MNEIIQGLFNQSLIHETVKDINGKPIHVTKQNPKRFAELVEQWAREDERKKIDALKGGAA